MKAISIRAGPSLITIHYSDMNELAKHLLQLWAANRITATQADYAILNALEVCRRNYSAEDE